MLIIGFCNLKGGVGKTTACQNVAVGLARSGKRVAVLDMDPQSNLSASFGISVAPGRSRSSTCSPEKPAGTTS